MDEVNTNAIAQRTSNLFSVVGNGRYNSSNGNSRKDNSGERVIKSRSNDWYNASLSTSDEIDLATHSKENHFPKSITANILSPKVTKHESAYENRILKSGISSGRWPCNSIEDQERETTRSYSNPAISSSMSAEDFSDFKNVSEPSSPGANQRYVALLATSPDRDDDTLSPDTHEKTPLTRLDSLPHHRERLSQWQKKLSHGRRRSSDYGRSGSDKVHFELGESDSSNSISSSSSSHSRSNDVRHRKCIPSRMTHSLPLIATDPRRPQKLTLDYEGRGSNSLSNVGSWIANQSFDYMDSHYSAFNTIHRKTRGCPIHSSQSPLVYPRDEILFGNPTPRDVTFNVSGQHYRVDPDLLARFPDTLLGNREKRAKYWDSLRKEYFLDRHKATFEVVIDYYINNGTLTRPDDIPIDIFINEIKFYCLDRDNLLNFLSAEGILLVVKEKPTPNTPTKKFIWNLFEDPESCLIARLVTTMSALVIAVSVIVFCTETLPVFHSLGEESLKNIAPALTNCSIYLQNRTEFFIPEGNLFAPENYYLKDLERHRAPSIINKDANQSFEHINQEGFTTTISTPREPQSVFQTVGSEIAEGTTFDEFDGEVILSTMQKTLTICAEAEPMTLLSKYTFLRCEIELTDAYAAHHEAIFEFLKDLEVHEHGHEDSHEEDHKNPDGLSNSKEDVEIDKPSTLVHSRRKRVRECRRRKRQRAKEGLGDHEKCPVRRREKSKRIGRRKKDKTGERKNSTVTSTPAPEINETKLLSLPQTIRGLNQLCLSLDNTSIRSSYAWFVLEATIGGPAGQLFLIESGCIVWFVIEILLRFYSCPSKIKFCTNFLNIVDAIAIMPYFITLIVTSLHTDSNLRPQTATILRTIRLVRMLRILKLSRHSRGLRILGLTLVRSTRVLILLICFQMVLAVTFSSIAYYIEYDVEGTHFTSIPGTFWWAIITMTTVGYGDSYPITTLGKITGAFCAIMGILGIAFPVPVIVSNFNYLYNLDSDDCKLTPEELMGDEEENDKNNNVEKFQENLFDAVRRNVGSMTSAPQEGQPTGQNPAELWNYTRRQYHSGEKKSRPTKEPAKSHKFAKGIIAIATASALTVSLPDSTTVSQSDQKYRRRKATSI